MWVWICCGVALLVFAIIFAVAALRTWRQVKALKASLGTVQAEVQSYVDRLQLGAPPNAVARRHTVI